MAHSKQQFKREWHKIHFDNMDFNSDSITPDFDADDINIFEELSSSNSFSKTERNPLEQILLGEDEINETIAFDSDVIADLLQVLAHHAMQLSRMEKLQQMMCSGFGGWPRGSQHPPRAPHKALHFQVAFFFVLSTDVRILYQVVQKRN